MTSFFTFWFYLLKFNTVLGYKRGNDSDRVRKMTGYIKIFFLKLNIFRISTLSDVTYHPSAPYQFRVYLYV